MEVDVLGCATGVFTQRRKAEPQSRKDGIELFFAPLRFGFAPLREINLTARAALACRSLARD